jgi:dolichyl-phosphate-mannose-protein mannosyltransferase
MTRASDSQDQTEARRPGIRGWFQPTGRPATGAGSGEAPAQVPDETTVFPRIPAGEPEISEPESAGPEGAGGPGATLPDETTVFPRIPVGDAAAGADEPAAEPGDDELPTAEQAPLFCPPVPPADDSELPTAVLACPERSAAEPADEEADKEPVDGESAETGSTDAGPEAGDADTGAGEPDAGAGEPDAQTAATSDSAAELPDETTVFPRVPPPVATPPKISLADRPPDITRPQLILDDTMVDMAAVRGNQKPGGTGSNGSRTAAAAPAAGNEADEEAAGGEDTPAGKSAKRNRSVFGPEPASRPDMLTNAETVVMASLKDEKGPMPGSSPKDGDAAASTRNASAVKEQAITAMVPVATSAAFAEATTQVMPTVKPSEGRPGTGRGWPRKPRAERGRPPVPPRRYTPGRRTTMISRLLLLAILTLQAVLSLRLRNTAFEDESLYLYSGHMELEHLLHGTPLYGGFASYFSGAPVLYPVLAAALNMAGGLELVRALSLFEMLATTALLYTLTRRLFNERAGLCAAGIFSVSEAVIFLGNFATFDATCLFLLACATWVVVRTAASRWPVFLLAAPIAALAVAVKYAGLLFVPTIAVLPALAGWPERGRRVLLYPVAFGLAVAGILYAALRLGGPAYLAAIRSTTTNRAQGAVPAATLLREAAEWGGVLFAVAIIGTIAYVWRVRTEPDEKIAPAGGRVRRIALGVVLTGTALLAPAYQAHLHTDISFLKHIGFGLFFAAPMAGFGLARVMGDYFRRPQIGIGVWSLALVLGMVQSNSLYHVWPSSATFVQTFAKYLKPDALYLVEVPEVPMYYLQGRPDAQPRQFTSTYPVPPLTTNADFAAVVKTGEFQMIAYTGLVTPGADQALGKALAASRSYYLAAKVSASDSSGPVTYYIWVKGHKPASGGLAGVDPHVADRHGATGRRLAVGCRAAALVTGI